MGWKPGASVLVILLAGLASNRAQWQLKRILERDLQVITLYEGVYTTSRRTPPVPQLRCFSGCWRTPKSVQCYNRGWDGNGNNWECKAALPDGVVFGQMEVNCEGYDYPDDPYITVGSCSLGYSLISRDAYLYWNGKGYRNNAASIFNLFFHVVVIITVVIFICTCCMPWGGIR